MSMMEQAPPQPGAPPGLGDAMKPPAPPDQGSAPKIPKDDPAPFMSTKTMGYLAQLFNLTLYNRYKPGALEPQVMETVKSGWQQVQGMMGSQQGSAPPPPGPSQEAPPAAPSSAMPPQG